ncbi:Type 1 glutamine amidotransferase-like domain-containing protein [Sediminibacillus albus]|uniref:Type 1 glutamine amidotransferase-like domain-containing protein n=1 Tax=Sediminibacillus albus TaxID=407036 RepID=UPI000B27ADFD|nr:Type 1 glutamine amidotransferase-like domain-containing protein [Sediminibacillus albus]
MIQLGECSGIIIGGGETERYRDYIVDTRIGKKIKELYRQGVPVAGFSAGALLSPEFCVIPPIDNSQGKHLFLPGLGLIQDLVVSVHYTKWQEESNLQAAVATTGVSVGYGINDQAGCYFLNQSFCRSEGEIELSNNKGGIS